MVQACRSANRRWRMNTLQQNDDWIFAADALQHVSQSVGSNHLAAIYLRSALLSGEIECRAACAFTKQGMLPKEMLGEIEVPHFFWKHAEVDWDDLKKPIVRHMVKVAGPPRSVLPYLELHLVFLRAEDFFRRWSRLPNNKVTNKERPATGYAAADRELFPKIEELLQKGQARGAYGAAMLIADRIAGRGAPENRAKRLADRFNEERRGPL